MQSVLKIVYPDCALMCGIDPILKDLFMRSKTEELIVSINEEKFKITPY